jgi:hypothetical protein
MDSCRPNSAEKIPDQRLARTLRACRLREPSVGAAGHVVVEIALDAVEMGQIPLVRESFFQALAG